MCSYCDNDILGKNEEHLARVLYGGKNIESRDEGKLFRVKGFDYRKVKNALLSILWRMSLSSHPYFDEVCLGKKHTEKIRVALYNELAMREDEYPIFFCVPLFDGKHMGDWIIPPDFTRCEGNRIYRCLVSGFLFTFHIGSEPLSSDWQILNLKKDGSWNLLKADVLELPFLKDWCLEVGRAQNLRDQKALSK